MSATVKAAGWVGLLLVAAQLAAYGAYRWVEGRRASIPQRALVPVSGPAPDIEVARQDGSRLRLSALRGRVVVLHFWATWCAPCIRELPGLLEFAEKTPEVQVLAVHVGGDWKSVRAFLKQEVPTSVVLGGAGSELAYDVRQLPQTFVIDSKGELALHAAGSYDWSDPRRRAAVLAVK